MNVTAALMAAIPATTAAIEPDVVVKPRAAAIADTAVNPDHPDRANAARPSC
jgi:hypothetical protein